MKILITGGAGFIGKNLNELLGDKYNIVAPNSKELDLLDSQKVFDYIKTGKFDVIIHAATWNATRNSKKDTTLVLGCNCKMFFNIARCGAHYGKMIYYGSGAEYDREHWLPKMREEYFDKYVPQDLYGFSKYVMRKYAEKTENIYNLCVFGVYGKYEDWEIRFISNACCKAVYDMPITIKQDVFIDYLHVEDLARITDWFMENTPRGKSYNICTGRTTDLKDLAEKVKRISNKRLEIHIKMKGVGVEYSGDNSRLISEIGDYKFKGLEEGIYDLYNWYAMKKHMIDKEKVLIDK